MRPSRAHRGPHWMGLSYVKSPCTPPSTQGPPRLGTQPWHRDPGLPKHACGCWQARGHANGTDDILTPAFVALLVETPEKQIPRRGQGWLWGPLYPPAPTLGWLSRPSPNKVFAHRTESGLSEEGGNKLVVLDVVDFGLFDGSTAVHCWELGLVFTAHRLFAIWGPWGCEVSPSPRKDNIPAVPPGVAPGRLLKRTASLSFRPGSSL